LFRKSTAFIEVTVYSKLGVSTTYWQRLMRLPNYVQKGIEYLSVDH